MPLFGIIGDQDPSDGATSVPDTGRPRSFRGLFGGDGAIPKDEQWDPTQSSTDSAGLSCAFPKGDLSVRGSVCRVACR